jgi:plastocyanin
VKLSRRAGAQIVVTVVAVAAIILFVVPMDGNNPITTTRGSIGSTTGIGTTATTNSTDGAQSRVAVGGGNLTVSINQFSPSDVEIQPGQSVTFYAPSGSTELHNVVFDLTNGAARSSIELAFILPSGFSSETLELAPPDNFGEPIIQNTSDGRQAILALNKVLFHPSTIDQHGEATFLHEQELIQQMQQGAQQGLVMQPLSANYTMQGTEVIVSSGLMLDVMGFAPLVQGGVEGQQQQQQQQDSTAQGTDEFLPPAYPILSNFTVTFTEPGVYPFFDAFHPGMAGFVNVVDGPAIQNQTRS